MKYVGNICFVIGLLAVAAPFLAIWAYWDSMPGVAGIFSTVTLTFQLFCLSRIWRYTTWAIKRAQLTGSLANFQVRKGDRICVDSGDGSTPTPYVVTNVRDCVIEYRDLRWYERLHVRLKVRFTFPRRNYYHPNGVLTLTQAYSRGAYYIDEVVVVPDTRTGRIVARIFDVIEKHQDWVCKYDMDTLDIREGEYMPWWSLSYWWFMPVRIANRFFPRVSGEALREWPQEIE